MATAKQTRKIKVIGAGGIGSHLLEPLARYLSYTEDYVEITVIDGDKFEERNRERQRFNACANKAEQVIEPLKQQFPRLYLRAKPEYLTEDNVIMNIREGDVVFLCVDNHATRKLVSDRCQELDNVLLISGGNDYTDGNVIRYVRQNGRDITKSPVALYDKIAKPQDKNPGHFTNADRAGCDREAQTNPQLLFMNLAIASWMLNCYYSHEQGKAKYEQIYVDILTGRSRTSPECF
jgi:molybdopterin/thiamine biosynthesis adenylyltransferase